MAATTQHHDTYPFISPTKFIGTLTGKVVLVTGASRGIGRATALAFAAAGASVAALARTSPDLTTLISEIKTKYNTPAVAIVGDVLTDSPSALIKKTGDALGPIDVLINNAGITRMAKFEEENDIAAWWKVHEVNVKAPMALLLAVIPGFLARGHGTTITVGSAAASSSYPYLSAYSSSKASIQKSIQMLDLELRPKGILNYVIHPGAIFSTGLGQAEGAMGSEEMTQMMNAYAPYMIDTTGLGADTMVALVALGNRSLDERVRVLSGRYYDATWDLKKVLGEAERIEKEDLFKLVNSQ